MTTSGEPKLVFHYAVADNGVIGMNNAMPWHVSTDLRRFKEMTMGKPLVMGRRTYQSIGRPLPGRANIVVTRDEAFNPEGVIVVASLEAALDVARARALADQVDEIAVIGGGTIYNALWDQADRLYVTHIHAAPEGDTFLPAIDPAMWYTVSSEADVQGEQDSAPMSFAVYERIETQG
ncbi:dihydrofolate reductase [Cohaesibacter sp. ES.047]|uniref:dihydrofolate reductase n=1 Tax=Cohaesibacter sp. ES.047 TaxID=1798205 RepID=UPI000BB8092B|nr:dihydrofolate reductase [Cohaesibacter sp. ES.047]SNY94338.1 dihydrofolate reductase [Cohaesibacter sp. ES.047]